MSCCCQQAPCLLVEHAQCYDNLSKLSFDADQDKLYNDAVNNK